MRRFLFVSLVLALLVGLFTFISAKGPEYHANYIRSKVGSRTVMVMGNRGGGSGFFLQIEDEDYILTNAHVCNLADKNGFLKIYPPNASRAFLRKIVKKSDQFDLCLVEGIKGYDGLNLAGDVDVGETIGIVGHPTLQPLTLSKGELIGYMYIRIITGVNVKPKDCKFGTIVKLPPSYKIFNLLNICVKEYYSGQITAYSRGGSSGSPVVNFFGNIVGVLFAGNPQDQFQSFIVPLDDIKRFLEDVY